MPSNATSIIVINTDIDTYVASLTFGGKHVFSPQETTVRFRAIPANVDSVGLQLQMPPNPSDGDTYEWIDADGTCSLNNIVTVSADPGGTATFGGQNIPGFAQPLTAFTWTAPNSGAKFVFDAPADQWLIVSSPTPLFNTSINYGNVGQAGAVSPGNFAGGAAINLVAFLCNAKGLGLFTVRALLDMIVAAADADVVVAVEVIPNVTAFSGGTLVSGTGSIPTRYETGAGAGQPVVVTGDAPTAIGQWTSQIATGDIGHVTASLSLDASVGLPTKADTLGNAIVITLASAAQAITGLKLNASVQELLSDL